MRCQCFDPVRIYFLVEDGVEFHPRRGPSEPHGKTASSMTGISQYSYIQGEPVRTMCAIQASAAKEIMQILSHRGLFSHHAKTGKRQIHKMYGITITFSWTRWRQNLASGPQTSCDCRFSQKTSKTKMRVSPFKEGMSAASNRSPSCACVHLRAAALSGSFRQPNRYTDGLATWSTPSRHWSISEGTHRDAFGQVAWHPQGAGTTRAKRSPGRAGGCGCPCSKQNDCAWTFARGEQGGADAPAQPKRKAGMDAITPWMNV